MSLLPAIHDALRTQRLAQGDRWVGWHVDVIPQVKIRRMGVHAPHFSLLMASSARPENSVVTTGALIEPRVSIEIGFVLKKDFSGAERSVEDVMAATDYLVPVINVVDFSFHQASVDVIAGSGASGCYVIGGRPLAPEGIDLRSIGVVIEKNGDIAANAASAAVFNHPANAVVLLARHLAARGEGLPAGSLVMTGAITETVAVRAGDYIVARVQGMGTVSVRFAC